MDGGDPPTRSLAEFSGIGYDKGRSKTVQVLWFAVLNLCFVKWWMPPCLRPLVLRLFGAKMGRRVFIRHRVRVLWPWKLEVGDDCWIGEGAWLLNLEPIRIGHDVCLSQEVLLCTGSHDRNSASFEYDNAAIVVEDCVWVAARATVLRGVRIGKGSVVGACALVTRDSSVRGTLKL